MSEENFEDFSDDEEQQQKVSEQLPKSQQQNSKVQAQIQSKPETSNVSQQKLNLMNQNLLASFKKKIQKKTTNKKQVSQKVQFKQIGHNQKIIKLSEIYLPISESVKKERAKLINEFNGLKEVENFEKIVSLAPYDLTGVFYDIQKQNKDKEQSDHQVEEKKKKPTENSKIASEFLKQEIQQIDFRQYPTNLVESQDLFQRLYQDMRNERFQNQRKNTKLEHYTELMKTLGQERKEKIEEEKIKRQKQEKQQKQQKKVFSFDMMLADDLYGDGSNANSQSERQSQDDFDFDFLNNDTIQNATPEIAKETKAQLQLRLFKQDKTVKHHDQHLSYDTFLVQQFKKFLTQKNKPLQASLDGENYTKELKKPNFFKYIYQEKLDSGQTREMDLNLDIYCKQSNKFNQELKQTNYFNNQITDILQNERNQHLQEAFLKFPLIDLNNPYFHSFVNKFQEIHLKNNKKKQTKIVIDPTLKNKRKQDTIDEQRRNEVMKNMRMQRADKNLDGNLSDEEKQEVLMDKDNKIRNLLLIEEAEDFNDRIEVVYDKRKKLKKINHSPLAKKYINQVFTMNEKELTNLYRPDIYQNIKLSLLCNFDGAQIVWKLKVVKKSQEHILKKKLNKNMNTDKYQFFQAIIQSHEIFKKSSRLSLKSDNYILIEYIEQKPLILSNYGMCSRVEKWIYLTRTANHILKNKFGYKANSRQKLEDLATKEKLKEAYYQGLYNYFGKKGEEIYLTEKEELPTVGQVTKKNYCGVSLLDNNLSRTPIFIQRPKKQDLLLVIRKVNGKSKYYVRRIQTIYVAGQIQPKQEIFSPYSRQYNNFYRTLQKYYIKKSFEQKQCVDINHLKRVFPQINDHNLRKQIKLMGGKEDEYDKKKFYQTMECTFEQQEIAGEDNIDVEPEEICLYQRMHQSNQELLNMGINELKSTDKLSVVKTKFYKQHIQDVQKTLIAKRIIEEIQLSAWYVSQSFLLCSNNNGRMYLEGFGDPTNGHGGINFIKLPQKLSRYESKLQRTQQLNQDHRIVSGSASDLRGLNMDKVEGLLIKSGQYTKQILDKLERWDKINYLRRLANRAAKKKTKTDFDYELIQYSRNTRMTTEKQKEKYQKDINQQFMKLITNLSKKHNEDIHYAKEVQILENMEILKQQQQEDLKKYAKTFESDEEKQKEVKPRKIKEKRIILKDKMKVRKKTAKQLQFFNNIQNKYQQFFKVQLIKGFDLLAIQKLV